MMLSERSSDSHKGENGKVAVIGGSIDYAGAPALSAQAALRTGADLTKILTSHKIKNTVASYSENLIVRDYRGEYFNQDALKKARKLEKWADMTIIGPGLGQPQHKAVKNFSKISEKPLTIDADAIGHLDLSKLSNAIITPHRQEFKQLKPSLDTLLQNDNIILRKGPVDKIYTSSGTTEVELGHPGMTVGGTGDILTGIVASLVAQGLEKEEAAIRAAKINGKAGEKAARKYGNGVVATDLLKRIPKVILEN